MLHGRLIDCNSQCGIFGNKETWKRDMGSGVVIGSPLDSVVA